MSRRDRASDKRGRIFAKGAASPGGDVAAGVRWRLLIWSQIENQIDKVKRAAVDLETDNDLERIKERVRKLVKYNPVERQE